MGAFALKTYGLVAISPLIKIVVMTTSKCLQIRFTYMSKIDLCGMPVRQL